MITNRVLERIVLIALSNGFRNYGVPLHRAPLTAV